ncbi:MAG: flavin reductase [Oscillospiraceae bacterium]|nr:flavin reductase [Oscillospiraceae bacterium]
MFIQTPIENLPLNPFAAIGNQWMLITAVRDGTLNTMTASWGGLGVLWHKNVATIYVRPQRYTHEFLDASDTFTLSFLPETYREALTLCGKMSGRDGDKIAQTNLTTVIDGENAYFQEAELVLTCRKIYKSKLDPEGFIDSTIDKNYPIKDYHTIYIGEIQECIIKQLSTPTTQR